MEKHLSDMTLEELLAPEGHDCACGKHHSCGVRYLKIDRGAAAYEEECR